MVSGRALSKFAGNRYGWGHPFCFTHLPVILTGIALAIAAMSRQPLNAAERFLAWLLLLPVGVEMLWAGSFHVFFPHTAASFIDRCDNPPQR